MTTKYVRPDTFSFGKERLGFSHKDVGTHSLRSGFTIELFLENVYLETIMIIGWWDSKSFLWYICIQVSNLCKGISDLTTNKHALYTIP